MLSRKAYKLVSHQRLLILELFKYFQSLHNFLEPVKSFHVMSTKSFPVLNSPEFLTIPSKPSAPISYTFFPGGKESSSPEKHLIVFVNGLGLPASSWLPAISILRSKDPTCPAILTYDRFAQGNTTSHDPLDSTDGKEHGYGHDFMDVATDLHEVITAISILKLGFTEAGPDNGKLHLLLIGASIGVPIVRIYAQKHPGTVAAAILLDSNIANVDYSDFWPNPDSPYFDPKTVVSADCTLEQYKDARKKLVEMFDLKVKNPECLDRRNSPILIPYSDSPKLIGPGGKGPFLTVVGHDPETFADMSFEMMGTPKSLSTKFTNALVNHISMPIHQSPQADRD
jgi:pimeloyl-ACP methyl ester carboxylesterase